MGRADEAEKSFRRAIALWPEPPLFYSNLGDALRALGRVQDAERAYMRALSLDISNYLPNLRMGELLLEQRA
jgi:Flp pilus assembly protein TadD